MTGVTDTDHVVRTSPLGDGRISLQGTAVARAGKALLVLGPSGAGKSGLAAQMIAFGAMLVSDDLVILEQWGGDLHVSAPKGVRPLIELRGIGPTPVPSAASARLAGVLRLAPSCARLPEPETLRLLDIDLPLIRHPALPETAAKALLWLDAA